MVILSRQNGRMPSSDFFFITGVEFFFLQIHSISTYKNCTVLILIVRVYIDVACFNILRRENRRAHNYVYIFFLQQFHSMYFIVVFYNHFYTSGYDDTVD